MTHNKIYYKTISLLTILLLSNSIYAHDTKYTKYCKPTKIAINDYEPETFMTSNNLLNKPGETPLFCGERIVIYGKVIDHECRPVSDAKVYLWQVGCNGKYPYTPLRSRTDKHFIKINDEQSFTGNGIATTDNRGEFVFITTYPNRAHGLKPHVNARVEHRKLSTIQTRLTLPGNKLNSPSNLVENQSIIDFVEKNNTGIYGFRITLPPKPSKISE